MRKTDCKNIASKNKVSSLHIKWLYCFVSIYFVFVQIKYAPGTPGKHYIVIHSTYNREPKLIINYFHSKNNQFSVKTKKENKLTLTVSIKYIHRRMCTGILSYNMFI